MYEPASDTSTIAATGTTASHTLNTGEFHLRQVIPQALYIIYSGQPTGTTEPALINPHYRGTTAAVLIHTGKNETQKHWPLCTGAKVQPCPKIKRIAWLLIPGTSMH